MTVNVKTPPRAPTVVLEVSPLAQGAQGISTYIRGLLDGLRTLRDAGEIDARFRLLYLNPHERPPEPPGEGFENVVFKLPRRAAQAMWARFPILPLDLFAGGDLFHGCSHVVPYTRCPAWVTMHDVSWRAFPESFGESQRTFNEKFCGPSLKHCLASGGGVVADSHFAASEVVKYYGHPVERLDVVHLAIEAFAIATGSETRSDVRSWAGIASGRPFLLCLGLVEKRKNIEGAIGAWEALRSRGIDCALVIAGKDGTGADGIRQRASASPWSSDILLPGRAPQELLGALYAEAAATLFLSHYEGFGLPVLESMAAGTPIVVSDRASLPEIWGTPPEGTLRLVADPDRPENGAALLERLLLEPETARLCREYGFARVRDFSWEKTARQTWECWRRSLQSTGRIPSSAVVQRD